MPQLSNCHQKHDNADEKTVSSPWPNLGPREVEAHASAMNDRLVHALLSRGRVVHYCLDQHHEMHVGSHTTNDTGHGKQENAALGE